MRRFPSRSLALLAALLTSASGAALADPAPAAAPAPSALPAAKPSAPTGRGITEIVVTGSRPAVENRIDRRVYAVSGDLQADLGSAADVLRNIPSVSVDLEGNPSLRGDADVQILIDGRNRPEFNGPDRGAALEALAAKGIDRIEVMTNPPASYKREGSAGIINIITRRTNESRTASVQAGLGSNGRWNAGADLGAQLGKLSLRGSAGLRHELRIRDISSQRAVRDDSDAALNEREQRTHTEDDRLIKKVSVGADFDLSDKDRLSAEGTYYRRDSDGVLDEHMRLQDADGAALSQYERERRANTHDTNSDASLRFHHAGEGDDDGLTITLARSEAGDRNPWRFRYSYAVPDQADQFQSQRIDENELSTELSLDFATTFSDKRRWTAGYDVELDAGDSDRSMSIPASDVGLETPDPAFTNLFRASRSVHALYTTYEQPFGDWTVLAGLRIEQADLDLHQVTSGERSSQHYFRVYPSLHVSRKLNEQQTLTFSYARRVRRPFWQNMVPYVVQIDPNYFIGGNPELKPTEIDAFDLAWNYDVGSTSLSASVYGRQRHDLLTEVTTLISPTAVLVRPENLGDNRSGGLELTASGKLGGSFSYNLSANAFYDEIDATNLGFTGTRSTITNEAKAALNWRLGEKDQVQINAASMGRRLTPQGYRLGSSTMDLGYRHQFGQGLSLSATLSDVFASRRDRTVLDTPALSEQSTYRPIGRIVWLGLTWTMVSGKNKPADNFEYEN